MAVAFQLHSSHSKRNWPQLPARGAAAVRSDSDLDSNWPRSHRQLALRALVLFSGSGETIESSVAAHSLIIRIRYSVCARGSRAMSARVSVDLRDSSAPLERLPGDCGHTFAAVEVRRWHPQMAPPVRRAAGRLADNGLKFPIDNSRTASGQDCCLCCRRCLFACR